MDKNELIRNAKDFNELLDIEYGKRGRKERDDFEKEVHNFALRQTLKDIKTKRKEKGTGSKEQGTRRKE
jgi:hypothetical protein